MELSLRLKKIAQMVEGKSIADIGCDHCYLPIYMVKNNLLDFAVACDSNSGPLSSAKANIEQNRLTDKIEARHGYGLDKIKPGEVSCIVMAGMGGILMKDILREGIDVVKSTSQLVLQPQRNIKAVRKYIQSIGFRINNEAMVYEDFMYYTVISAVQGEDTPYSPYELLYGRVLIKNKDKTLKKYLTERIQKLNRIQDCISKIQDGKHEDRISEIKYEKKLIKEVMECL